MEKVYPVYSVADRLAPLCLAQFEGSSVTAEPLEFKLSFKSVKPGHSDSVLDQVNEYLTYPGSYFNVPQTPVIPRGSSSRRTKLPV